MAPARPSLRLEADYQCSPLWSDEGNLAPEELPITPQLARDLWAWAGRYEATLNQSYPPHSWFTTSDEAGRWLQDGWALQARLSRELAPGGFVVTYESPPLGSLVPPDAADPADHG